LKEKKRPLIILSAVCICLIFLLWTLNNYVFDRPSFCKSCHLIQSACDSWQKSQHKPEYTKNSCNACHLQPGLFESIKATAYGLKNTYTYFFGIEEDDIKASKPVNCTRIGCHTKMEESMYGKRIRVNHGLHMNMGYSCVVCHDRVAHEEYGMVKNLSMMRDFCFACHNDEIAPQNKCNICHIYQYNMLKGIDATGESSSMASPHYREEETCRMCHQKFEQVDQKTCLDCHQADTDKQYQRLKSELDGRISQIKLQIDEVKSRFNSTKGYNPVLEEYLSLFQKVQENYFYLQKDNSRGAHNKWLTLRIVKNMEENIQKIRYFLYNYQDYRY